MIVSKPIIIELKPIRYEYIALITTIVIAEDRYANYGVYCRNRIKYCRKFDHTDTQFE